MKLEEYNGLIATLELTSDRVLHDKILAGKDEPIGECVDIDEVDW